MTVTALRRPFPFVNHRTLAEVRETERLLEMAARRGLHAGLKVRLAMLLRKQTLNNPPPEPSND